MKEKIVILYGKYGDGHQQAARAISESFNLTYPNVDVDLIDFMELVHPYVHHISRFMFEQGVKKFPSAYGFLFSKSRHDNQFSNILKKISRVGLGRLLKQLQASSPSIIVSTFPLAAGAMSALREFGLTNASTATVITDHTDHSSWIHPFTDIYLVGSEFVKQRLIRQGIPDYQISVTGIPIRPEFHQGYCRDLLMRKHGLDPSLRTVLIMGGGCGMLEDGSSLARALDAVKDPVQFIIVCGRNRKLQHKLEQGFLLSKHNVHVKGYVDYVHELMAVSDFMISKPGGITTSEALAMNVPMVLYKPIPGQETDNAQYLMHAGTALEARGLSGLVEQISGLLNSPDKLQAMRNQAAFIHKTAAGLEAVEIIMKYRSEFNAHNVIEQWVPFFQS